MSAGSFISQKKDTMEKTSVHLECLHWKNRKKKQQQHIGLFMTNWINFRLKIKLSFKSFVDYFLSSSFYNKSNSRMPKFKRKNAAECCLVLKIFLASSHGYNYAQSGCFGRHSDRHLAPSSHLPSLNPNIASSSSSSLTLR